MRFEVPTPPKMCTIIVTVQADTQMGKVAFSIRWELFYPSLECYRIGTSTYLSVPLHAVFIYTGKILTWLHGDFVVWARGAPNTLDWWRLNFFDHTARLLFISRWIRYVRAMQWWMLDAVSSKHSLSVLLSAMETNRTTQTALVLAVDDTCIIAVATI